MPRTDGSTLWHETRAVRESVAPRRRRDWRSLLAIKILPSHLSDNSEAKQRFEREARAISSGSSTWNGEPTRA